MNWFVNVQQMVQEAVQDALNQAAGSFAKHIECNFLFEFQLADIYLIWVSAKIIFADTSYLH